MERQDRASDFFVPLLKLGTCLFVSAPSALRDSEVRALQDAVAKRLASDKTVRGLVLDISAVGIIDSYSANVIGEIVSIARSFGTRAVLVGMRPSVAVTLVELGIDLPHVETALTLELALAALHLRLVQVDHD